MKYLRKHLARSEKIREKGVEESLADEGRTGVDGGDEGRTGGGDRVGGS